MKGLETILESNRAIRKAHRLYRQFTADEKLMEQYEARQKYLRDVATIKHDSYNEGFEKGEKKGEEKGEKRGEARKESQMVLSMHQKGMDSATIA